MPDLRFEPSFGTHDAVVADHLAVGETVIALTHGGYGELGTTRPTDAKLYLTPDRILIVPSASMTQPKPDPKFGNECIKLQFDRVAQTPKAKGVLGVKRLEFPEFQVELFGPKAFIMAVPEVISQAKRRYEQAPRPANVSTPPTTPPPPQDREADVVSDDEIEVSPFPLPPGELVDAYCAIPMIDEAWVDRPPADRTVAEAVASCAGSWLEHSRANNWHAQGQAEQWISNAMTHLGQRKPELIVCAALGWTIGAVEQEWGWARPGIVNATVAEALWLHPAWAFEGYTREVLSVGETNAYPGYVLIGYRAARNVGSM